MTKLSPLQKNIFLFLISLLIYGSFASDRLTKASSNNHFAYLAQAFLAGKVELLTPPPHGNDWASYEELELTQRAKERISTELGRPISVLKGIQTPRSHSKKNTHSFQTLSGDQVSLYQTEIIKRSRHYFVSFPPLPAIIMSPFVAVFGLATSDVWLTLLFASLNTLLAFNLFRELLIEVYKESHSFYQHDQYALWLTLSLCFGTAHVWCAVRGEVWFTALILGVTFQLLFLKWAWKLKRPLLAGLAYSAAFSTRASLVLLALFIYPQVFSKQVHPKLSVRIKKGVLFSLPPLVVGSLLLIYNAVRFENPLEFGHRYLAGGQISRIYTYGLFHWVFLKKNLIAAFALLPLLSFSPPFFTYSWHGMSLTLSNPQYLFSLALPLKRFKLQTEIFNPNDLVDPIIKRALYLFILSILTLLLCYQNTGWVQYSWRFSLDFLPALSLIVLFNLKQNFKLFKWMTAWGIVINLWGAFIFGRHSAWWESVNLPMLFPH